MTGHKMRQQTFDDLSRTEQLNILRDARLNPFPLTNGKHIMPRTLKATLNAIDNFARQYGECFASTDRLASVANISVASVQRATKALTRLDLITTERKINPSCGKVLNHHRIVWTSLRLLVPTNRAPCAIGIASNRAPCAIGQRDQSRTGQQVGVPEHGNERTERPKAHEIKSIKIPPPTSSSAIFSDPWTEVEEALAAQDVAATARVVASAQDRQLSPSKVLDLVQHFATHRHAAGWGPGALVARIRSALESDDTAGRWPPGRPTVSTRGDAEPPGTIVARVDAARARQRAERAEQAEIEATHGAMLDALPPAELRYLADQAFADQDPRRRMFTKHGLASALVREGLLQQLAAHPPPRVATPASIA